MPQVMQTVQYVIDYMKGKGIDVCCHVEGSNNYDQSRRGGFQVAQYIG